MSASHEAHRVREVKLTPEPPMPCKPKNDLRSNTAIAIRDPPMMVQRVPTDALSIRWRDPLAVVRRSVICQVVHRSTNTDVNTVGAKHEDGASNVAVIHRVDETGGLVFYTVDFILLYKNTADSRPSMRNRIESELRACTAELHYLQSGASDEETAKADVYKRLTECEDILHPVTVCYDGYLHIKDFKSRFLPNRQDSVIKPIPTSSATYTKSDIARIKSRTYSSVINILTECEETNVRYDWSKAIRVLKGRFYENY